VENALSNVNQDKNLLSRQVFGVLLLRNFIGESSRQHESHQRWKSLAIGPEQFPDRTNQRFGRSVPDLLLTWILRPRKARPTTAASQAEGTTNYQLRLQKSFFEDRLTFKLSVRTSVGERNGDEATSALENASVEYALTPKGN
jgi:hypothetical protein